MSFSSGFSLGCVLIFEQEKGSAITEFAISLIFLITVIFGLIDVSLLLTNYQKLEQAVREGVRTASRLPQLTPDIIYLNQDTQLHNDQCNPPAIPPPATATFDCQHTLIHARIRSILRHEHLIEFNVTSVATNTGLVPEIQSLFCPERPLGSPPPTNCPDVVAESDTIIIRVNGEYNGFFGTWPVRASYQGPWLYQSVATN